MAEIIKGVVIEIDSNNPQESLDQELENLSILAENFLSAVTISLEERNNTAKIIILYTEETP